MKRLSKQPYQTIDKESIANLRFPQGIEATDNRLRTDLHQAMILGNSYKTKCIIFFKTLTGLFRVETTVWAYTDNYLVLKGGVAIPINCIESINL